MSVDSIDAEPEEDEENEPLIDSDDKAMMTRTVWTVMIRLGD